MPDQKAVVPPSVRPAWLRSQRESNPAINAATRRTISDPEISKFLESRDLRRKANADALRGDIDEKVVTTFTFNDTVLIVYRTHEPAGLKDVKNFCKLLRKFAVDSQGSGAQLANP